MASIEQCRTALDGLAKRLSGADSATRKRVSLDRKLACRITDLRATFVGQLRDGELQDISRDDEGKGQITLTVSSDDLVALTEGTLRFPSAWASGRLKVDANVFDLVKLRALL
ncbi:alkyl sulfatase C-terminal domain-containing protein [Fodinicola feengrottensis]|uniref:Alkyl sulfatase C-terminal domain-containing protein n=1 Tax=Fodinicola feengrottensis TaxID=435914 RepID=A0ABN2HMK7_9ACTN|nr:SCP2 sterol-binding domain-containing protein [Fodinicola feengrottensis]